MTDQRPVDEILAELDLDLPGLTSDDKVPDPPLVDKTSIEKIDVANPAAVLDAMGVCFDSFGESMNGHAKAAKAVKHWKGQVSALTAALTRRAEGKDAEARKQWVQELVHQSQQWAALQVADAQLAEYDTAYEYLSKQGSLLQSILKRFETERWEGRFGKGAGQTGQGHE